MSASSDREREVIRIAMEAGAGGLKFKNGNLKNLEFLKAGGGEMVKAWRTPALSTGV